MTPARTSYYAWLGGLLLGSAGIDVLDMDDLLSEFEKRHGNRVIPQQDGAAVRPMYRPQVTVPVELLLSGEWTQDNVRVPEADRVDTLYEHLADLRAVTRETGLLELTAHLSPSWVLGPVDVQVTDGGRFVRQNPWAAKVVVSLTLPGGAVVLDGGS
jgi:hypothetical protein